MGKTAAHERGAARLLHRGGRQAACAPVSVAHGQAQGTEVVGVPACGGSGSRRAAQTYRLPALGGEGSQVSHGWSAQLQELQG